ncbi:MAG: Crp/Fnr family transcriptional regulator [Comamonadaceae bacterium]|nr:MAG: Crp/Fnr family transcriptional regulator [Comamonadaceae bacterium]
MLAPTLPPQNHLLAALPAEEYARLAPHLEMVTMTSGDQLYAPGVRMQHAFFPVSAIVSLLYVTEDGHSTEVAVVGNEGIVGVSLFMGGKTTISAAQVQSSGTGYRLAAPLLVQEFERGGPTMQLLLRYTQALMTQMTQTAVCSRHLSIDQQLSRRLLLSHDRESSNELKMTHEQIANLLGVRRESVTQAANKLQSSGLIQYRRGHITVSNRAGLEALAGECYAVVKKEFDRLLPATPRRAEAAFTS